MHPFSTLSPTTGTRDRQVTPLAPLAPTLPLARRKRAARHLPPLAPLPVETAEFVNLQGERLPPTGGRLVVERMDPEFLAQVATWMGIPSWSPEVQRAAVSVTPPPMAEGRGRRRTDQQARLPSSSLN